MKNRFSLLWESQGQSRKVTKTISNYMKKMFLDKCISDAMKKVNDR